MRLLTFSKSGLETVGVLLGEEVVDLSVAAPRLPGTLLGLIKADLLQAAHTVAKRADATSRVPLANIQFLPIMPRPPKIFGFGVNYGSHVGARPQCPGFFVSTPSRLVAHNEAIVRPKSSPQTDVERTLDYEVELALVMRKSGKYISARDALDYVAGYTIFNDGSLRGFGAGPSLGLMKNGDKTAPFGPVFVTPDELPAGADGLRLSTRRNGKVVQDDTTSKMFWKVPEIIEMTSQYMTLHAGDVITTGTPGGTVVEGVHKSGKPLTYPSPDYLQPGDVVECEVEGIGVLRNPVIEE